MTWGQGFRFPYYESWPKGPVCRWPCVRCGVGGIWVSQNPASTSHAPRCGFRLRRGFGGLGQKGKRKEGGGAAAYPGLPPSPRLRRTGAPRGYRSAAPRRGAKSTACVQARTLLPPASSLQSAACLIDCPHGGRYDRRHGYTQEAGETGAEAAEVCLQPRLEDGLGQGPAKAATHEALNVELSPRSKVQSPRSGWKVQSPESKVPLAVGSRHGGQAAVNQAVAECRIPPFKNCCNSLVFVLQICDLQLLA